MCQLNFVVRLLIFEIYDEVHQSLIPHQHHFFLITYVYFLFFISSIFIFDDRQVLNNTYQAVDGYLLVPKLIL